MRAAATETASYALYALYQVHQPWHRTISSQRPPILRPVAARHQRPVPLAPVRQPASTMHMRGHVMEATPMSPPPRVTPVALSRCHGDSLEDPSGESAALPPHCLAQHDRCS